MLSQVEFLIYTSSYVTEIWVSFLIDMLWLSSTCDQKSFFKIASQTWHHCLWRRSVVEDMVSAEETMLFRWLMINAPCDAPKRRYLHHTPYLSDLPHLVYCRWSMNPLRKRSQEQNKFSLATFRLLVIALVASLVLSIWNELCFWRWSQVYSWSMPFSETSLHEES